MKLQDWEPSAAIPIINAHMTLEDVVENIDKSVINVYEGADQLYIFRYRDTIYSQTAESYINIPDESFSGSYGVDLPESVALASGTNIEKSFTETFTYDFIENMSVKYADLKSGLLQISLSSDFMHDVTLTFTINSLKNNGIPLTRTYNLSYTGVIPVSVSDNIDLTGYRLDLSGDNSTTNSFSLDAHVSITSSGNPASSANSISYSFDISNLGYRLLYGNVGEYVLPRFADEVTIEIFENALYGDVYFSDPRFKLELDNSLGVPVSFTVDELQAETDYGEVIPLTGPIIPGPNTINYPSFAERGSFALTQYHLTKDNGYNVVDAFNPAPSKIQYGVTAAVGTPSGTDFFVLDTSRIKVYAEAEIPMHGRIGIFSMADTAKNLDLPDREFVESATFKLRIENYVPVEVWVQGYWLDSTGTVLDSLVIPAEKVIASGPIDANGEVISPMVKYTEIHYDAERYSKIADATSLLIRGDLRTSDNGSTEVKFFSYNYMKVQLSVLAQGKIAFD